ncbi:MAG: LysR family transcriptional regulator [Clostridia bacterium]|nr:LysR family transcriptional regulator [Clostridia bacterium]
MTLQQIFYALTVARTGSMNKAAGELFISQPTLTSAIKELERDAGIEIFSRSKRGVVPTRDGEEFLLYARQLYQQYELLKEKYGESGSIKRKFGVSTQHYSFAVKAFVETVKKFDMLKYDFAIREVKTHEVIQDVANMRSEVGILYLSDLNRRVIEKMLMDNELEYEKLIKCSAYVYLWKGHPLARESSINLAQLQNYPCLSFEQGEQSSFFFAEEILSDKEYPRTIHACDRATMLNLMVGLNGYTLCSGIICDELNGSDYTVVPFLPDEKNENAVMEIVYIKKKYTALGEIGQVYINEVKKYLESA